ncbi:MAG: hypothetical protein IJ419_08150 [Agathobacter sp.]|nr:hypothetical protein [Agathobacter sp.]
MSTDEVRKIRFDYCWKTCAICIPILGAACAYFQQEFIEFGNAGNIVILGFITLTLVALITLCHYLYSDFKTLKDDNGQSYAAQKEKISQAYDNIFLNIKFGGIYLLIHTILLAAGIGYQWKWTQSLAPQIPMLYWALMISAIFTRIPYNKQIQCVPNPQQNGNSTNPNTQNRTIQTNSIKKIQWIFYNLAVFSLLYIMWIAPQS